MPATRVEVVGGGPGGLYAAILLARAGAEVSLHERNPRGETFGFGVVFSAATLDELEAADGPSHAAFHAASARWDPVAIRRRGTETRARGNAFAAIGRHELLRVLEERALAVGVDVAFGSERAPEAADADLVIVAEGARSETRSRLARRFRPSVRSEGSAFIWLGTRQPFDAFTFIFIDTPDGLFTAHVYPYAANRATFIVECDRDTWRKAGLDRVRAQDLAPGESDEHTIAVLSEVFADHLGGHALEGNGSYWRDWTTVRTASWRHGNVVLLGDAAHTAHFSIGSGTKLALEDAIALASRIRAEPELGTALTRYEAQRRPRVERVQAAAVESLDWFARYRRYWHFPPEQFAYSLLTRSARVDHDNLRRRDPALARAVDAALATGLAPGTPVLPRPPWLLPLQLGGLTLANRAVVVVRDDQAAVEGLASVAQRDAVAAAAGAGAGLVLLDRVAVSAHGRATTADLGLWTTEQEEAWAAVRWTQGGSRRGTTCRGLRLCHAGPRGSCRPRTSGLDRPLSTGGWALLAASPRPYRHGMPTAAALDARTRREVTGDFAAAAARAARAGFDLVVVDAGHGGLLASFLSPLTNHRDDELGGPLDARLRFPREVVAAVRDAWPGDRPLLVRMSGSDLAPGGLGEAEAVEAARAFVAVGADAIEVVAGQTVAEDRPDYDGAYLARWSDLIRNEAGVPTLVGGGVADTATADHLLASGKADLVVVDL